MDALATDRAATDRAATDPVAPDTLAGRVLNHIMQSPQKAVFVAELETLAPPGPDRADAVARSLTLLEERGRVMIRAHSCGDPHLARVDLTVAVLIDDVAPADADRIQTAILRDQAVWNEWITEFLRNHSCG